MGIYTDITRNWLERRFARRLVDGVYLAHMPVYGVGSAGSEGGHAARLARLFRLLRSLDGLRFSTLLDVGGAEGYLPHLARTVFGARAVSCDLSVEACRRARELFGIAGAAVDAARLPFADGAFDVVVCSEVLAQLEHPVHAVLELQRVARSAVLVTTEEVHHDRAFLEAELFRRPGWPWMARNPLHPDDLATLFPGAALVPQCDVAPPRELADRAGARTWLLEHTRAAELLPGRSGAVVEQLVDPSARMPRAQSDGALLDRLLGTTVTPGVQHWAAWAPVDPWLVERLRDPREGGPLRLVDRTLVAGDGLSFAIRDGVPDLVVPGPGPDRAALQRRLEAGGDAAAERRAGLLALHDRLHLPEQCSDDFFDFRSREARRGFWANDQLEPRAGRQGFAWFATGPDPWVLTPCLCRRVTAIELEMRVHNPDVDVNSATGQVFWKGPDDQEFGADRCVPFAVPNDGVVHTHRVELGRHAALPATVQWLRLDLLDGPGEVDLLSLRLSG